MKDVKVGQRYKHYKGKTYTILGVGHHSETEEKVVVYEGEYEDPTFGKYPIWVRPYEMFVETVEWEGERVPRFTLIEDNI